MIKLLGPFLLLVSLIGMPWLYVSNNQQERIEKPWEDYIPAGKFKVVESDEGWFSPSYYEEVTKTGWIEERCSGDEHDQDDYWYKMTYSKNERGQLMVELKMSQNLSTTEFLTFMERRIKGRVRQTVVGFDLVWDHGGRTKFVYIDKMGVYKILKNNEG